MLEYGEEWADIMKVVVAKGTREVWAVISIRCLRGREEWGGGYKGLDN